MNAAQAQMFGEIETGETLYFGKRRGPRPSAMMRALMPGYAFELLRFIFETQRDESQTEPEQAGEVLERYVIEAAPDILGITLDEYAARRRAGVCVDLAALFAKRGRQ